MIVTLGAWWQVVLSALLTGGVVYGGLKAHEAAYRRKTRKARHG